VGGGGGKTEATMRRWKRKRKAIANRRVEGGEDTRALKVLKVVFR